MHYPCPEKQRTGSALVEFAIIALVLIFLIAATLDFGRAIHGAQVLQQAADVGARELARVPLPPAVSFHDAVYNPAYNAEVRLRVYDESLLVVQLPPDQGLLQFFADKPVVNQQLALLMIVDEDRVARYPGAVPDPNDGIYKIPLSLDGTQGLQFVPVFEEIRPDPQDLTSAPFSLLSTGPLQGHVALRINYPFQAAGLVAYQHQQTDTGVLNVPIEAPPLEPGETPGPYAGADGLGKLLAHARTVRPFRRLISAQAIYRREVFSN